MAEDTTGILASGPDNTIGDSRSERGSDNEPGTLRASESWMSAAKTVTDAIRNTVPSLQKLPIHNEVNVVTTYIIPANIIYDHRPSNRSRTARAIIF